jgi:hypothetical protein
MLLLVRNGFGFGCCRFFCCTGVRMLAFMFMPATTM